MEDKKRDLDFDAKKEEIKSSIKGKLRRYFAKTVETATDEQLYKACAFTVRDELMEKWANAREILETSHKKELYYLSFEFLMGRALGNNIMNIMQTKVYEEALKELGADLLKVEETESDAGLGNGGLGRLAACFLDSLSTLGLPAFGCGIRYEYGLFKQKIVDGYQIEMPDPWLESGNVWEIERPEDKVEVKFGGKIAEYFEDGRMKFRLEGFNTVIAVPYDMPISGYDSELVNTLRLWRAKSPQIINMNEFNRGDYTMAVRDKELAEVVSQVLYPEDNHYEGKQLRLKQQYFFVSATIQWIIAKQKRRGHSLSEIPKFVGIHINDTHPTLAIPEFMRIMMDEEGFGWDDAWEMVGKIFAYTNHTIMSEALEKWPLSMVESLLPRIAMIIKEIDRRHRIALGDRFGNDMAKIDYMSVISKGNVNMANLCLAACHSVNGVAALHTDILKNETFHDYFIMSPEKFKNVTNGVTPRRWLLKANPRLAELITETIGDGWIKDACELEGIQKYAEDKKFCGRFGEIKLENKKVLAEYIQSANGITVDPESMFDVQIKRLHEYKRQLLKVMHIIYRYKMICENPKQASFMPETFIFGAKAAPGYHAAKLIIKLINSVAEVVNSDPRTKDILKVVFIENYSVSIAEKIVAAANLSEQISTASKEASGTGNMKLMLNGAITIGTLDGANVEIAERVGNDNIYIFGLNAKEVLNLYHSGHSQSSDIYSRNMVIKAIVDSLIDGTFSKNNQDLFRDIYYDLIFGKNGFADPYLHLRDFESYLDAAHRAAKDYAQPDIWNKKAIINVSKAGYFSSDRSIVDYNRQIWNLEKL